jgi:hypothetical protein
MSPQQLEALKCARERKSISGNPLAVGPRCTVFSLMRLGYIDRYQRLTDSGRKALEAAERGVDPSAPAWLQRIVDSKSES